MERYETLNLTSKKEPCWLTERRCLFIRVVHIELIFNIPIYLNRRQPIQKKEEEKEEEVVKILNSKSATS
jgi:hypothetical protein